jgi:hypothetical protein
MGFCSNCGQQLQANGACSCQQPSQPNPYGQANPYQQPPQQNQFGQQQNMYGQPQNPYQQPNQFPPQYGQPPGQTMIRVTGILMIILGGLASIGYMDIINTYNNSGFGIFYPEGYGTYLNFALILVLAILVAGIIATAVASKRDKAGLVIGCGVTCIILQGIDIVWALSSFGDYLEAQTIMLSIALGAVLPVLLIIGGNKLKNS